MNCDGLDSREREERHKVEYEDLRIDVLGKSGEYDARELGGYVNFQREMVFE